jgi:hypothetical protein
MPSILSVLARDDLTAHVLDNREGFVTEIEG